MTKIKVSQEVKEQLDVKVPSWEVSEIIEWHLKNKFIGAKALNENAGQISTVDLVHALTFGYSVPATLNSKQFEGKSDTQRQNINRELATMLNRFSKADTFTYDDGVFDGINAVLDMLGIKVDKNI